MVALSDGSVIKGFTIHQRFGRGASAIYCDGGSPLISGNKISANWAATAISCRDASPIISDNLITTAEDGIFSRGGSLLILRNIISDVRLANRIKSGNSFSLPSRSRIQNNIIHRVNQGIYASWNTEVEIVNKGRGWTVCVNQPYYELSYNDIWGAKGKLRQL